MNETLAGIQGEWKVVALEMDGVSLDPMTFAGSKIVIEANRFTSLGMGEPYMGTIEIQDSGDPKTFAMHFTEGPEKGNTNFGIYELNGNTWKICLSTKGGPAPPKFATTQGSGLALEVLQRDASKFGTIGDK